MGLWILQECMRIWGADDLSSFSGTPPPRRRSPY